MGLDRSIIPERAQEDKMRYRCIKEKYIQKVDDDGFEIPNEYGFVRAGSIWEEGDRTIIGGDVHLDALSEGCFGWIEISSADLQENFVPIKR